MGNATFYQIKETLTQCSAEDIFNRKPGDPSYVVIMDPETWNRTKEKFDMVIDMDMDPSEVLETKAIVNFDSLTGTLYVPRRSEMGGPPHRCAFALDEKGIIFIENGEFAQLVVQKISWRKRWKLPSLERFLYDFLEALIERDLRLLVDTEHELGLIEDEILGRELDKYPEKLNDIRSFLMDMRIHYEQMLDFGQELEENENGFFKEENLRYFRLFTERVMRLMDQVKSLRDYTVAGYPDEPDHDSAHSRHGDLYAADADRRLVRHELCLHAGASLEIQLSGGLYRERADPDRRRDLVPQEKMAVRTMF